MKDFVQHVGHVGVRNVEVVAGGYELSDMGNLVPSTDGSTLVAIRDYDPAEDETVDVMPEGVEPSDAWRLAAEYVREKGGEVDFTPPSGRDRYVRTSARTGRPPDGSCSSRRGARPSDSPRAARRASGPRRT